MKPLDPSALPLSGRCLIEASAGTGKTYTITTLVMRLLIEEALELEQILIVTYTRAATAELKERVRSRVSTLHEALARPEEPSEDPVVSQLVDHARQRGTLQEDTERVERALYASDQAAIFTIHGFCQRVLTDFAFEADAPFDWELMSQSEALVAEVAHDYWTLVTHDIDADCYARLKDAGGPEALVSLIARTLHGQLPHLLPKPTSSATPERPGSQAWLAARDALREAWPQGRTELASELPRAKLRLVGKRLDATLNGCESLLDLASPPIPRDLRKSLETLTVDLVANAEKAGKPMPAHPMLSLCDAWQRADAAFVDALDAQVVQLLRGGIHYARAELERRTQALGRATFDQLLGRTHAALRGPQGAALGSAIRARYRAALIDEFQDTDPLQYAIFDAALGSGTLLLIGDPKQAIYGFRGADVYAYLNARSDVAEQVYTMGTNHRSDPGVIAGLNHLYAHNACPFGLDAIRYEPVKARPDTLAALEEHVAPLELLWMPSVASMPEQRRQVATRTASDIVDQLSGGMRLRCADGRRRPLSPGDIAVLCRTNRQARWVQHALAEHGVPSVLQGDDSVFDTPDAVEVERAVAALADPHDSRVLRTALAGQYVGLSAALLDDLDSQPEAGEDLYTKFLEGQKTWLQHGFMRAFRDFLRAFDVDARLLGRVDGSRRWTNLQHLLELLQEASVRERLGPPGLLRWLRSMRSDAAKRAELLGQATQIRLESHGDAVTLTTVHRSKGLEYPVVYVPFAWDGMLQGAKEKKYPAFHRPEDAGVATLDLGSADIADHRKLADGEARSEALRLLYVALTRARHALRVVCPSTPCSDGALSMLLAPDAGKDSDAFHARLAQLAESSHGAVAMRTLAEAHTRRYTPQLPRAGTPRARAASRNVVEQELIASFTSLSQERPVRSSLQDDGVDHDERAALEVLREATTTAVDPAPDSPWLDFPRGPSAGTLVHTLLENVPADAPCEVIEAEAATLLPGRGLSVGLAAPLARGVHAALRTPLDDRGLTLASITPAHRVVEMEFMFRVHPAAPLDGRALFAVLARHDAPTSAPGYARAVARLPLSSLRGYLRGFVDLIFEHEDRYFIVDYKSNHLGDHGVDYRAPQLCEAMGHHHYYLQYLLYSVALHRYLDRRVPGYDYARHFGGVYYLFLRGMSPEHGPARGVFFDLPSAALITDLDRVLHTAQQEAG